MIPGPIATQGFELVRDRIAQILLVELNDQAVMGYHPEFDVDKVYVERFSPINQSECDQQAVINVRMERGDYHGQDAVAVHGTYRFFVEVTTRQPGTEESEATSRAKLKLHKILGAIRSIIQNPIYITLDFDRPFVMNRHVEAIMFNKPEEHSWDSSCQGFVIVVVKIPEYSNLKNGVPLAKSTTSWKIGESEQGYYWEFNAGA